MKFKSMSIIPKCRADFEQNINMFSNLAKDGKVNLVKGDTTESMVQSFVKLRGLPNQRIDFLSVDERARLMSNSTAYFLRNDNQDIEERKEDD